MWQERSTKYGKNSFKFIQVCGSREQQSMVQTHSSMWQQRIIKYSTNSFKYEAAENNKVQYKLINEFVQYFVVLCYHILE
jgi:hypothetical protein